MRVTNTKIKLNLNPVQMYTAAGQKSFEDYFPKGALLGQKAELNLWYFDNRPNSQKMFPSIGLSYLAYKI